MNCLGRNAGPRALGAGERENPVWPTSAILKGGMRPATPVVSSSMNSVTHSRKLKGNTAPLVSAGQSGDGRTHLNEKFGY